MLPFRWDPEKNTLLKSERGVCYDDLISRAIVLDIVTHPVRTHQHIIVWELDNYIYCSPCIIESDYIFLKTLYPDRKKKKKYTS